MISKSSEYAIRSLAYLALAGDRWVLNREIADELELPSPFLTKLLGTLTREGLLESQRGRTGGFRLAKAPEQIRLLQIVDPFDRLSERRHCLLGQSVCSETHSCPLHTEWKKIQDEFRELFAHTTLAETIATLREDGFPRARVAGLMPHSGALPSFRRPTPSVDTPATTRKPTAAVRNKARGPVRG
ncbi:MAG: Rrf2 family transcriptional regulator [Candidatus Eisenbacteria bacterium]|nr:Rrf2 family transcriptional regulator [Candidatus Eisenbacteria bacterium]MCC7141446.1 Rrf2 family transcriptional regulator [Candidatus Eisenbacteria bacterium]